MVDKCDCEDWGQCFERDAPGRVDIDAGHPGEFAPQMARIENWIVAFGNRLGGEVYGHPSFSDGRYVYTSSIWHLDEAAGTCRTQNTLYTLGKKA